MKKRIETRKNDWKWLDEAGNRLTGPACVRIYVAVCSGADAA
jgi:hypothetical protein